MLCAILEHLLLGPSGLASAGLPLLIGDEHRMLYGRLANLLSDGDGHRQGLDWKGANGLKPCFKHSNVLKKDGVRLAVRTCSKVKANAPYLGAFSLRLGYSHRTAILHTSRRGSWTLAAAITLSCEAGPPRGPFVLLTFWNQHIAAYKTV